MATSLGNSWDKLLKEEIEKEYFSNIRNFLIKEYSAYTVYPPKKQILAAFEKTAYEDVKVVIIGQDPYHGDNQANGLAFSVNKGVECPPSLKNIFKAIEYDLGIKMTSNGDLSIGARQGVFLLNTILTVRAGCPQSHCNIGWEKFTNKVVEILNNREKPMVFLLWGNNAKQKLKLIDTNKHLVLTSVHPSPLSFYHGFLECKHFSKANEFLLKNGMTAIDWSNQEKYK